jgi:hypothetical protein
MNGAPGELGRVVVFSPGDERWAVSYERNPRADRVVIATDCGRDDEAV